jgi:hypothetical protein
MKFTFNDTQVFNNTLCYDNLNDYDSFIFKMFFHSKYS